MDIAHAFTALPRRTTSALVAGALLVLVSMVVTTSAQSAGGRVYLAGPVDDNEQVALLYKPKSALLDDNVKVVGIKWSAWGKKSATGTGTAQLLTFKSGDADHEHPKVAGQFKARLTLSKPDADACDKPVWDSAAIKRLAGTQPKKFPKKIALDPMCFE